LEEPLRNYILGIPWERKLSYHRLDERMRQIAVSLYESGGYKGSCYFVKTGEKVILGS
jgi:non-ribosomal peptide synthetase component E (peptide arylation enzyme)